MMALRIFSKFAPYLNVKMLLLRNELSHTFDLAEQSGAGSLEKSIKFFPTAPDRYSKAAQFSEHTVFFGPRL